ncbi:MAG: EF-hand domain-containing protein [Pirellulaceae bacterium]|nr:EF-hand domain-containing protein [Pirellulaceae bacterium]
MKTAFWFLGTFWISMISMAQEPTPTNVPDMEPNTEIPEKSEDRFEALDTDGDGVLTEDEFVALASGTDEESVQQTQFKEHDLDRDHRISFLEFQTLPPENPTDEIWFAALNRSNDKFLDYEEFMTFVKDGNRKPRHRQFLLADQNDDMRLSEDEFAKRTTVQQPGSPEKAFRLDDVDFDGMISKTEFIRKLNPEPDVELRQRYFDRWFDVVDTNRDGQLNLEEHRLKTAVNGAIAFVRKDLNVDGQLTIEEMFPIAKNAKAKKSPTQKQKNEFRLYDENEDELISATEYQSYVETTTKFQNLKVVERSAVEKMQRGTDFTADGPSPPTPLAEYGAKGVEDQWMLWGIYLGALLYAGWLISLLSRLLLRLAASILTKRQRIEA